MSTLSAVVVDDEPLARNRVLRLLRNRPDINVVGHSGTGTEAIERIRELAPDLVFLDVQLPDIDGFQVLASLQPEEMPGVIFVTAYDSYAIKAFEVAALDYLLKPYDAQRFGQAVDRALTRFHSRSRDDLTDVRRLLSQLLNRDNSQPRSQRWLERFAIREEGRVRYVPVSAVDWIESEGNYVRLHVGATSTLARGTIASVESTLDPDKFIRVHRRFIVQIDRIREAQRWFSGDWLIILTTGAKVRLGRSYRESFQQTLHGRDEMALEG